MIAQKSGANSLVLTDSTVAGNRFGADLSVGGVSADGEATIVNSTITGNVGGFVGGIEIGAAVDDLVHDDRRERRAPGRAASPPAASGPSSRRP